MLEYGIEIQQRLANGILGGPFRCDFSITLNSVLYEISIEQMGIRKTSISTNESVELDDLIVVFNKLDMLIMLGEGQFIPIEKAWIIKNGKSVESKELDSKIAILETIVSFYRLINILMIMYFLNGLRCWRN